MTSSLIYFNNLSIAFSVLVNVLFGGHSNQTFAARNYQWKRQKMWNFVSLIDSIFGTNHCVEHWAHWYVRKYKADVIEEILLVDKEKR